MAIKQDSAEAIVITGVGAVTPIGTGAEGLWRGALSGHSGVDQITRFDPSQFSTHIAAEVNDFDPSTYLDAKQARRFDRYSQFALACATMALDDAGLDPSSVPPDRVGVCIGTALGGISYAEKEHVAFIKDGPRAVSPLLALSIFAGAGSCNIAIEYGFTGPASANGDSCASSPVALGNALHYLQRGEADVMIAGGAEAPLSPLAFGAFSLIRAMSLRNEDPQTASRPFSKDRDGFVMAEGASVFVLETRRHAEKRGAQIYAELAGYSLTNDGHHMTAPRTDASASSRAMREAVQRAGLTMDEIEAISAHGSSTSLNDSTETRAIKLAFGEEKARRTPIFATKGLHAHALGATGAFEAALCCLAMRHGVLPGTANRITPDPDCDLDYVAEGPRPFARGPILSNSFGFGGINSCLVFKPA
ncbi:MAG: beta-ketoacyl-ACP synthase II [Cytophagales bacterium]|nr:beta-ketoacyl-ACP synthase II [Armatimonadota bacterium]